MKFLVMGLPRSRTAWLANFLTYDGQFCYHEGTNGCRSIDEYKEKVKGKGDSNTGLAMFKFEPHFQGVKTIIIDSDPARASQFGMDVFGADIRDEMDALKNRLDSMPGLHVKFDDINSMLREIWEYVSNKEFDQDRADMLIGMDINVMDPLSMDFESASKFTETIDAAI